MTTPAAGFREMTYSEAVGYLFAELPTADANEIHQEILAEGGRQGRDEIASRIESQWFRIGPDGIEPCAESEGGANGKHIAALVRSWDVP